MKPVVSSSVATAWSNILFTINAGDPILPPDWIAFKYSDAVLESKLIAASKARLSMAAFTRGPS